jgi:hypothetical protein
LWLRPIGAANWLGFAVSPDASPVSDVEHIDRAAALLNFRRRAN